jgi:hypothetical protein
MKFFIFTELLRKNTKIENQYNFMLIGWTIKGKRKKLGGLTEKWWELEYF